jgi:hypothetical protein
MRKWTLAAVVALLALALASVALANFTQVARVTLTGHRAGSSTGIRSDVASSDPTAPGQKPKSATSLVITFPAATRFNLKTPMVTACGLSDRQLTAQFGRSCPKQSLIGTGTAVANASPLALTIKAAVRAYVGKSNRTIILVIKPTLPGAPTIVIRAIVSGARLTIPLPRLVLGKGPGFPGVTVVLVSLKLNVPALGRGGSALITAGTCQGHEFVVRSHFIYADHTTLDLRSSSRCA